MLHLGTPGLLHGQTSNSGVVVILSTSLSSHLCLGVAAGLHFSMWKNLKELLHISAIRFLLSLAKIRDEPRISTSVAVVDVPCPSYLEFRRAAKSKKSSS